MYGTNYCVKFCKICQHHETINSVWVNVWTLSCFDLQEMARADPICPPEPMNSEDMLFMLYTSGSTGKPKGVVHTQAGYLLYASLTHKVCIVYISWVWTHISVDIVNNMTMYKNRKYHFYILTACLVYVGLGTSFFAFVWGWAILTTNTHRQYVQDRRM